MQTHWILVVTSELAMAFFNLKILQDLRHRGGMTGKGRCCNRNCPLDLQASSSTTRPPYSLTTVTHMPGISSLTFSSVPPSSSSSSCLCVCLFSILRHPLNSLWTWGWLWTCCRAEANTEFWIFLPPSPWCWDYGYVPPCPARGLTNRFHR